MKLRDVFKAFEKPATEQEKLAFKERAAKHAALLTKMADKIGHLFVEKWPNEVGGMNDTINLLNKIASSDTASFDMNTWPDGTTLPHEAVWPKMRKKFKDGFSSVGIGWVIVDKKNINTPKKLLAEIEKNIYPSDEE